MLLGIPQEKYGAARLSRRRRVWVIPLLWVVIAFLVALIVPRFDNWFELRFASVSAASALALLSSIASGMMALTAIVFSLAFVFVQFGSTAYSPRIVGFFVSDPIVLHALGVFTGTFLFALIALLFVDRFQSGDVPLITGTLAIGWLVGSILMFLALIQRITSLQIANVLELIGNRGRAVIETLYPPLDSPTAAKLRETSASVKFETDNLGVPEQTLVYHGGPRVLAEINVTPLVELARRNNALFVFEYAIGDVVTDGAPILRVYQAGQGLNLALVRKHIALGAEHTIEQDPKYALRLLVDIAIKALSPAVNDPTTAVMSLNQIEDLLRRIGNRQLDVGYVRDDKGALRLIYPTPDWADFVSLAIDEIRYYGANSLQVMRRLGALLDDLEASIPQDRRPEVNLEEQRVDSSIRRTFTDIYDRLEAQQSDRQGLGLSRVPDDDLNADDLPGSSQPALPGN